MTHSVDNMSKIGKKDWTKTNHASIRASGTVETIYTHYKWKYIKTGNASIVFNER